MPNQANKLFREEALEQLSSPEQIKPGMIVQVTPSVVKRDQFGGIVGVVTKVSPFPMTTQDIIAQVGKEDLARSLANSSATRVQVFVELQKDPNTVSVYKLGNDKCCSQFCWYKFFRSTVFSANESGCQLHVGTGIW